MGAYPFEYAMSAKADANGNASVQNGPSHSNEYWIVTRQQVGNPGPSYPQVEVFKNFIAASSFIEGTRNGISGTSDTQIQLMRSEFLIWSWSNATPGTVCSVTIYGYRIVEDGL